MILDTSAVLAVLLKEVEAKDFIKQIATASSLGIAAPTRVEAGIVLGNHLGFKSMLVHRFLQEAQVTILPFTDQHWQEAVRAYELYGKGKHPAKLNFGDCFSYATAKLANQPLLFKGNDFSQTDIETVS